MTEHSLRHDLLLSMLVFLVIALPAVILAMFGDAAVTEWRYDRLAIAQGEWWRGITGHWVHLSTMHLGMNLAGLAVLVLLTGHWLGAGGLLLATVLAAAGISAGFYVLDSDLLWYVGLSGIAHAVWSAGALRGALVHRSAFAWILLLLLAAKTLAEIQYGTPRAVAELIEGPVIAQAHWYGAAFGVLAAVLLPRPPRAF
ncbi:MAG: rhombosortase [Ectothiorhodospiraceae bacterium]|nr:rhombosortase [Ectothiorhodospiraceae bacterium]MCH8503141.1 rhombosortase [Ectothiorhodospiraceae bacterium]